MEVEPGLVGRASQTLAPGLWLPDFSTPHATGGPLRGPEPRREPTLPHLLLHSSTHGGVSPHQQGPGADPHAQTLLVAPPREASASAGHLGEARVSGYGPNSCPRSSPCLPPSGSPEELSSQQGLLQALAQYWVGARVPAYLHSWSLSRNPLGGPGCLGRGWLFGGLGWDKGRGGLDHPVDPNHGP